MPSAGHFDHRITAEWISLFPAALLLICNAQLVLTEDEVGTRLLLSLSRAAPAAADVPRA
jgi:hypothetical protein